MKTGSGAGGWAKTAFKRRLIKKTVSQMIPAKRTSVTIAPSTKNTMRTRSGLRKLSNKSASQNQGNHI